MLPTKAGFHSFTLSSGEVVEGYELVQTIEKQGTQGGTPKAKVVISDSGTV
jgi:hypothetical protein